MEASISLVGALVGRHSTARFAREFLQSESPEEPPEDAQAYAERAQAFLKRLPQAGLPGILKYVIVAAGYGEEAAGAAALAAVKRLKDWPSVGDEPRASSRRGVGHPQS